MLAVDSNAWAKGVKDIRHYLVAEQLFWLFVLCILRTAEAPPAVFTSISQHAQIRWLTEQSAKEQTP